MFSVYKIFVLGIRKYNFHNNFGFSLTKVNFTPFRFRIVMKMVVPLRNSNCSQKGLWDAKILMHYLLEESL